MTSKFVGLFMLLLINVVVAEYDHDLECTSKHKDYNIV